MNSNTSRTALLVMGLSATALVLWYSRRRSRRKKTTPPPVPWEGISLAGLNAFVKYNSADHNLQNMTTKEVCEAIIKPATSGTKLSFCAQAMSSLAPLDSSIAIGAVGPANLFVSHAWDYRFMNVVAALNEWATKKNVAADTTFLWFDIFTVAQHGVEDRPFDWWTGVFADKIADIGHTVLVLEWENPRPLTRAWCVWEIAASVSSSSVLEVIMGKAASESFERALLHDFDRVVRKVCTVDVGLAQAWAEEDRVRILAAINNTAGTAETNKTVIGALRSWMARSGVEIVSRHREIARSVSSLNPMADIQQQQSAQITCVVARMLYGQGDFITAEHYYREAVKLLSGLSKSPPAASTGASGEPLPLTARQHEQQLRTTELQAKALGGLAEVLTDAGKSEEALHLFEQTLHELRNASEGSLVRSVLIREYARLLGYLARQHRSRRADATSILVRNIEALERDMNAAPLRSPFAVEIARCQFRLAVFAREDGKLQESLSMFERAKPVYLGPQIGQRHPESLEFMGAMAWTEGRTATPHADTRLANITALSREVLGDSHPVTLRAIANLSAWLNSHGFPAEAEPLSIEAMRGRLTLYGPKHRVYLRSCGEHKKILTCLAALGRGGAGNFGGHEPTEPEPEPGEVRFTRAFLNFIGNEGCAQSFIKELALVSAVVAGGACTAALAHLPPWEQGDMDVWVSKQGAQGLLDFIAANPEQFEPAVQLGDSTQYSYFGAPLDNGYLGLSQTGRVSNWIEVIYEVVVKPPAGTPPGVSPRVLQVMILKSYQPSPERIEELVGGFDLSCVQVMATPVEDGTGYRLSGPGCEDARCGVARWGSAAISELDALQVHDVSDWRRTLIRGIKYAARGFDVHFLEWIGAWTIWAQRQVYTLGDYLPAGWHSLLSLAAALQRCYTALNSELLPVKIVNLCCAVFLSQHPYSGSHGQEAQLKLMARLKAEAGYMPSSALAIWKKQLAIARTTRIADSEARERLWASSGIGTPRSNIRGGEALRVSANSVQLIFIHLEITGPVYPRVVAIAAQLYDSSTGRVRATFESLVCPGVPITSGATERHGLKDSDVAAAPNLATVWVDFLSWIEQSEQPLILCGFNGFSYIFPVLAWDLSRVGSSIPGDWLLSSLAYENRLDPENFFGWPDDGEYYNGDDGSLYRSLDLDLISSSPSDDNDDDSSDAEEDAEDADRDEDEDEQGSDNEDSDAENSLESSRLLRIAWKENESGIIIDDDCDTDNDDDDDDEDEENPFNYALTAATKIAKCFRKHRLQLAVSSLLSAKMLEEFALKFTGFKVKNDDRAMLPGHFSISAIEGLGPQAVKDGERTGIQTVADLRRIGRQNIGVICDGLRIYGGDRFGPGLSERINHILWQIDVALRFPMTIHDFAAAVLFGPRFPDCVLSKLNSHGMNHASMLKRRIADFCGVPYKAAFAAYAEEYKEGPWTYSPWGDEPKLRQGDEPEHRGRR